MLQKTPHAMLQSIQDTMLQPTAREVLQENQGTGIRRIIRTFDPEVPGYVFWLVMLGLISFHQLVLHVR